MKKKKKTHIITSRSFTKKTFNERGGNEKSLEGDELCLKCEVGHQNTGEVRNK